MTSIMENTDEVYCEEECSKCDRFAIEFPGLRLGICDCCLSDHYKHILQEEHPACEEFKDK